MTYFIIKKQRKSIVMQSIYPKFWKAE